MVILGKSSKSLVAHRRTRVWSASVGLKSRHVIWSLSVMGSTRFMPSTKASAVPRRGRASLASEAQMQGSSRRSGPCFSGAAGVDLGAGLRFERALRLARGHVAEAVRNLFRAHLVHDRLG